MLAIMRKNTTVAAEANRQSDIPPAAIKSWVEDGKLGMTSVLRAKPEEVHEQYQRQLKYLQEAYGEARLLLRARKNLAPPGGKDET